MGCFRTPPDDAVAKQLKDAGVQLQTVDDAWQAEIPGTSLVAAVDSTSALRSVSKADQSDLNPKRTRVLGLEGCFFGGIFTFCWVNYLDPGGSTVHL